MQRLSLEFLSFDVQDDRHATVATREGWADALYRGSPETGGLTKIGVRRPYTTVATYTLERQGEHWKIARIILQPDPPAWEQP
jgi:hypothetical protein